MFSGDRGSYLEIYITLQRIKILAYVLLNSITNELEDILKFFLFINIYGGINAFYYYFIVLQYSSPYLSLEVRYFGGTISDSLQKVLKKFPGPVPKP